MKKTILTRGAALLLSILVCLPAFAWLASAAGVTGKAIVIAYPRKGDAQPNAVAWGWDELHLMNGWIAEERRATMFYSMDSYRGNLCYCIEPGRPLNTGAVFPKRDETFLDNLPSAYNHTISPSDIKLFIGRILQYGYTGKISDIWLSQNAADADIMAKAYATQLLIWETVVGERDEHFIHIVPQGYNAVLDFVRAEHPLRSGILHYYDQISAAVQQHTALPSFLTRTAGSARSFALLWDGGQYRAEFTDENGVIGNYHFSAAGAVCSVDGNKLVVTAASAPTTPVTITATKNSLQRRGVIVWSDGIYQPADGNQDTVTFGQAVDDPIKGYVMVKVSHGSAKILKTSEDGIVSGIRFTITGNGVNETVTTGQNGEIQIDNLTPGEYTVTELADDRYVPQESKVVCVVSGQTAIVEFGNVLKKFTVTLTKRDSEKGSPQGDAVLAGAVYGIYHGDDLVDTYETDASGSFTTKEYVCGNGWTIREITPSTGYLLDETVYPVGAEAGNFTLAHNAIAVDVGEDVIEGSIAIIKHTDDGSTKIETPEVGAQFQIYRKASGSYDAADPDERDVLVCGEDGFAQSKALPYGEYAVEQTKGWDGRELMPAFTVRISEHGKTYPYLINNAECKAYLKIVKVDAETGKIIPYAGAAFEIYDPDGKLVEMTTTYPQPETHTRFVTNDGGWLITPEMLPYGTGYSIVEVQAPHGYVLSPEPVYFDVTAENAESADGITLVIAEKPNTPQKGKIQIVKIGKVFASVTEKDGRYTPVYGESGLAGAGFEIRAAEDVFTPDGTLRYAKGDVVDTLTTAADGTAESRELYLGKYEIRETKAPYGMVRDDSVLTAELTYAGQEISITSTSVAVVNERQKVEVKLYKDLEQDELFRIGSGDEILHVYFALYAAEELTAADGSVIPADGLIEIAGVQTDGTLVFASDLPIGSYVVKEYAVDAPYLISEEIYPITFTYEGDTTAVVRIEVNNGEAIQNRIIRGSITGIKVDEQGEPLPGAVFGLFRADCTDFTMENALLTARSAEDGSFSFENIPYGVWLVREIAAPEGYVLSDEIFPVQIGENGQTVGITVKNRHIPQIPTAPPTGERSALGFWLGLGSVALGGVIACAIMYGKHKRDEDDER